MGALGALIRPQATTTPTIMSQEEGQWADDGIALTGVISDSSSCSRSPAKCFSHAPAADLAGKVAVPTK